MSAHFHDPFNYSSESSLLLCQEEGISLARSPGDQHTHKNNRVVSCEVAIREPIL